jgi:hypothetical protein
MGNVIPQSHVAPPPPQTTVTNIKNTVQVDGRTIADIVASYIAKAGEHTTGGSGIDGMRSPSPVDATVL